MSPRGGVRRVILDVVFRMMVVRTTKQQRAKFRVDRRRLRTEQGVLVNPKKDPQGLAHKFEEKTVWDVCFFDPMQEKWFRCVRYWPKRRVQSQNTNAKAKVTKTKTNSARDTMHFGCYFADHQYKSIISIFSVMIAFEATKGQYVMQNCALNPMVVLVYAEKELKV